MLTGLFKGQQSIKVGGPIGSSTDAKEMASNPNYDAAYLAMRLGAQRPAGGRGLDTELIDRYTAPAGLNNLEKLVYLQNATKGYEAEAEGVTSEDVIKQLLDKLPVP